MAEGATWELLGFLERFDAWVALDDPSEELRRHVLRWIFTRSEDPFSYARREPGFDDLWVAVVPDSEHEGGRVVACSYWVDPLRRQVRCDNFGSLS